MLSLLFFELNISSRLALDFSVPVMDVTSRQNKSLRDADNHNLIPKLGLTKPQILVPRSEIFQRTLTFGFSKISTSTTTLHVLHLNKLIF